MGSAELRPGDHIVSSSALYGGTVNQFKHLLRKMNVELTWVDPDDPAAWKAAVRANTKAFYGETIGNPAGNVLDIETIAAGRGIRDLPRLRRLYGKGYWRKMKGIARIRLRNGRIRHAEIHWYEAHGIGKKEFKRKRYLDET